jgi:hypothetical protein
MELFSSLMQSLLLTRKKIRSPGKLLISDPWGRNRESNLRAALNAVYLAGGSPAPGIAYLPG